MTEEKKWITPTDEMAKRVAYHILIDNKHYAVYDIKEAYHSLGSANGSEYENHYFIYYQNEWVPYYSKAVHRICWDIRYKQNNTTKYKWDEWQLRTSGYCEMYANGKLIYGFFARTVEYGLSKAQYLTVALLEFPGYNFLNPEEEKGKKVWWHGLPATIQPKHNPWEISIHPDYSEVEKGKWWAMYRAKTKKYKNTDVEDEEEQLEDFQEEMQTDYINWGDAFETGGRIDWFRK
jgi:hypothetical protein